MLYIIVDHYACLLIMLIELFMLKKCLCISDGIRAFVAFIWRIQVQRQVLHVLSIFFLLLSFLGTSAGFDDDSASADSTLIFIINQFQNESKFGGHFDLDYSDQDYRDQGQNL